MDLLDEFGLPDGYIQMLVVKHSCRADNREAAYMRDAKRKLLVSCSALAAIIGAIVLVVCL